MNIQQLPYLFAFLLSFPLSAVAVCNTTNIPPSTPTADFTQNNDGTVTHNKTGLTWQVCSQGQTWSNNACTGTITTHTWQAALQIAQTLNTSGGYANKTDWRLPNIKELNSITEIQCYNPSINSSIFPSTSSSYYWSSSPSANYSGSAWVVDFNYVNDRNYSRGNSYQVRLVRGGQ